MPINTGEVNATLRFNVLTEKMNEAITNLKSLQQQFRDAGGAATEAGAQIKTAMAQAEGTIATLQNQMFAASKAMQNISSPVINNINKTTDAMYGLAPAAQAAATASTATAAATTGVSNASNAAAINVAAMGNAAVQGAQKVQHLKQQAMDAGEGISQMDRLVTRMTERLVVFYAVREAYEFIKQLFVTAEAMEKLSETTGNSIEMLQRWDSAGKQIGLSADKANGAVSTLQKNLVEFKGADALADLGLSFEQLFAMSPDQQIESIAKALNQVPSQAERARIEIALFGTDAIDPLIKRYLGLKDASNEAADAQIAAATKVISHTMDDYRGLAINLEGIATNFIAVGQTGFAALGGVVAELLKGDVAGAKQLVNETHLLGLNLKEISEIQPPPLMNEAFIDSLRTEVTISDELHARLLELNNLHQLTAQNAARIGATTAQYRAFTAELQETNKEVREQEQAMKRAQEAAAKWQEVLDDLDSAGEGWKATLVDLNGDVHEAVKGYLDAGVSQSTLAKAYALTAQQVKAVAMELEENRKAQKLEQLTTEETAKVWAKYREVVSDLGATAADKQIAANQRVYEDAVATARKRGIVDQSYYDALFALVREQDELVAHNLSAQTQFSRNHYEMLAKAARETYEAMMMESDAHTTHELDNARKEMNAKEYAFHHWREQAIMDMAAVEAKADEAAKKAKELFDMGGSMTYDLSTAEGMAQFKKLNPAASVNAPPEYFKNHTIQDAVQAGLINFYAGYAGFGSGVRSFAGGVEGFSGGPAIVGERGPELVHLPAGASVIPLGGGAGMTVNVINHINGTAEDVSRQVSHEIMRALKSVRQFKAV